MAKRTRWVPPHAEERPIHIPPRAPKPHPAGQCHWVRCDKPAWPVNPDTKLCYEHTMPVERALLVKANRDAYAREAAREQAVAAFDADEITVLPAKQAEGMIYFVETDGLIKIGFTRNPSQRLRHYSPNATILALYPGTMAKEKYIHGQFADALAKGREWFHDRPEIRSYIADRVAENGPVPERYSRRFRDAREHLEIVGGKRWSGYKKTSA